MYLKNLNDFRKLILKFKFKCMFCFQYKYTKPLFFLFFFFKINLFIIFFKKGHFQNESPLSFLISSRQSAKSPAHNLSPFHPQLSKSRVNNTMMSYFPLQNLCNGHGADIYIYIHWGEGWDEARLPVLVLCCLKALQGDNNAISSSDTEIQQTAWKQRKSTPSSITAWI